MSLLTRAQALILSKQRAKEQVLMIGLGIGYATAGRLLDELEALGIVGPYNGSHPRKILVSEKSSEGSENVLHMG